MFHIHLFRSTEVLRHPELACAARSQTLAQAPGLSLRDKDGASD